MLPPAFTWSPCSFLLPTPTSPTLNSSPWSPATASTSASTWSIPKQASHPSSSSLSKAIKHTQPSVSLRSSLGNSSLAASVTSFLPASTTSSPARNVSLHPRSDKPPARNTSVPYRSERNQQEISFEPHPNHRPTADKNSKKPSNDKRASAGFVRQSTAHNRSPSPSPARGESRPKSSGPAMKRSPALLTDSENIAGNRLSSSGGFWKESTSYLSRSSSARSASSSPARGAGSPKPPSPATKRSNEMLSRRELVDLRRKEKVKQIYIYAYYSF